MVLILYFCRQYPKIKFVTIPVLEKWLLEGKAASPTLHAGTLRTFKTLVELIRQEGHQGCFESISQIEFTMVGVLIYVHQDLSLAQLAVAVTGMREALRRKHQDIRANGKVTGVMTSFISKLKASDYPQQSTAPPAKLVQTPAIPERRSTLEQAPLQDVRPKRKRAALVSDDEEQSQVAVIPASKARKIKSASSTTTASSKPPTTPNSSLSADTKLPVKAMKFVKKPAADPSRVPAQASASPAATRVKRKSTVAPIDILPPTPSSSHSTPLIPRELPPLDFTPLPLPPASRIPTPPSQGARAAFQPTQSTPDGATPQVSSDRLAAMRSARSQAMSIRDRPSRIDSPGAGYIPSQTGTPLACLGPLARQAEQSQPASPLDFTIPPAFVIPTPSGAHTYGILKHSQSPPVGEPPRSVAGRNNPSLNSTATQDPRKRMISTSTTQTEPIRRGSQELVTNSPITSSLPIANLPVSGPGTALQQPLSPTLPMKPMVLPPLHAAADNTSMILATPAHGPSGVVPTAPRAMSQSADPRGYRRR